MNLVSVHLHGEKDALVTERDVTGAARLAGVAFLGYLGGRAVRRAVERRRSDEPDARPALAGDTVPVER